MVAADLRSKAAVAAQASRVMAHRVAESVRPRRPAPPGSVPIGVEDIDAAWLTAALCRSNPGAEVLDYRFEHSSDGTSARHALTVVYNEAGRSAGLPTELFTKTTPDLKTRLFTGLTDLFVGECNF